MTPTRSRALYLFLALALPVLLVGYANANFAYNHFFTTGPVMLDAGWFSGVIYRNGISLPNAPVADPHPFYWQQHTSLLFLSASLVSYLLPLDRMDFFWVFQGLIYLPFGATVALLFTKATRPKSAAQILLVGLAAALFTFNGQALACMGYPHYEIVIASGVCITLAGLVSGRTRVAWLGIALAVFTREDGGGQVCQFLAAVVACDLLGRPFPVERRRVLVMLAAAAAATVLMMGFQRVFFPGGSLFRLEYLGDPVYGHLTWSVVWHRVLALREHSQFVILPFGLALAFAAASRDARWLLGYAVTIPWFLLNLLAEMELKTTFNIYTGFPFIGSMFWLGAYGVLKHGAHARALWRMSAVSIVSMYGVYVASPGYMHFQLAMMASPRAGNAPGIRTFARGLRAGRYGRVLTDPSVAALALETLTPKAVFDERTGPAQLDGFTSFSFFHHDFFGPAVFDPIVRGGFTSCGKLSRSELVLCTAPDRPLPEGFEPYPFFIGSLSPFGDGATATDDGRRMFVEPGERTMLGAFGPTMPLPAQRYRVTVSLDSKGCNEPAHLEAFVFARKESLASADVIPAAGPATLDFTVSRDLSKPKGEFAEIRFYRTSCRYEITSLAISATLPL